MAQINYRTSKNSLGEYNVTALNKKHVHVASISSIPVRPKEASYVFADFASVSNTEYCRKGNTGGIHSADGDDNENKELLAP